MKWTQLAPAGTLWTFDELSYHLILDPDVAALTAEQDYVLGLQAAAVSFAEQRMGIALLTRTVTATYYLDDTYFNNFPYVGQNTNVLRLPRGPVQSITSVSDATGTWASSRYQLQGYGTMDVLTLSAVWLSPVTVVYSAGFGDSAASVPADIRNAVKAHVGTMYESRESVGPAAVALPHSLEAFYKAHGRNTGIG